MTKLLNKLKMIQRALDINLRYHLFGSDGAYREWARQNEYYLGSSMIHQDALCAKKVQEDVGKVPID